jgi:hypothetical protein
VACPKGELEELTMLALSSLAEESFPFLVTFIYLSFEAVGFA